MTSTSTPLAKASVDDICAELNKRGVKAVIVLDGKHAVDVVHSGGSELSEAICWFVRGWKPAGHT